MEQTTIFDFLSPNEESVEHIAAVRNKGVEFLDLINDLKPSRERSLAITKLEEAVMWANKSIVITQ